MRWEEKGIHSLIMEWSQFPSLSSSPSCVSPPGNIMTIQSVGSWLKATRRPSLLEKLKVPCQPPPTCRGCIIGQIKEEHKGRGSETLGRRNKSSEEQRDQPWQPIDVMDVKDAPSGRGLHNNQSDRHRQRGMVRVGRSVPTGQL